MHNAIKFLTLNLLHGGEFFDNIKDFLLRENADIMVFQEVYNGHDLSVGERKCSVDVLHALFPDYYFAFSPVMGIVYPEATYPFGNAIFSRFPIEKSELFFFDETYAEISNAGITDFSHHPKGIQVSEVGIDGSIFTIGNAHGIWGFDGNDSDRRIKMGEIILEHTKNKSPVIIAGDFNMNAGTKTIDMLEDYFTNIFKGELTSTFNMRHKTDPGYATAAVDMVFISHDLSVLKKSCPDDDVSDHKPLVVTLQIA